MQRSRVVLPLPDGPITTTTSPLVTSRSMPSRTRFGPNAFRSPRIATTGDWLSGGLRAYSRLFANIGVARLQLPAGQREAVVDGEVHEGPQDVERHRLVRAADHLLDGQHQVDDPDQGDERAALHRVHHRVDPRRQEAAHG